MYLSRFKENGSTTFASPEGVLYVVSNLYQDRQISTTTRN